MPEHQLAPGALNQRPSEFSPAITESESENLNEYSYINTEKISGSLGDFQNSVDQLKDEFQALATRCLGLSRVSGLLLAIRNVTEVLPSVPTAFHRNSSSLIADAFQLGVNVQRSEQTLSSTLEKLADSFHELSNRINEFKALADEDLPFKDILSTAEANLRYRASCVLEYEERYPSLHQPRVCTSDVQTIRYYIHQLVEEVQKDLKEMKEKVNVFSGDGVSVIKYAQEGSLENFKTVLTASTFFGGVTGSALQMAEQTTATPGRENLLLVTLAFWFVSMVFSIGAAMNSLLAIAWRGSSLGTRGDQLPSWPTRWTEELQLAFLGGSITTFSIGLVTYTYSSSEPVSYIPSLTLSLSILILLGVILVSSWMIGSSTGQLSLRRGNTRKESKPQPEQLRDVVVTGQPEKLNTSKKPISLKTTAQAILAASILRSNIIQSVNLEKHGVIDDIKYSTDGDLLAVACAKDTEDTADNNRPSRSIMIYDSQLNRNFELEAFEWHREGIKGRGRLYWSPSGKQLIIKFDNQIYHIDFRNGPGQARRNKSKLDSIRDITWNDDDSFLVAHLRVSPDNSESRDSRICRMRALDEKAEFLDEEHEPPLKCLPGMEIRSMSRISGFLIVVAEVPVKFPGAFILERGQSEKRILVYNMNSETWTRMCEIPTLDDIQGTYPVKNSSKMLFIIRSENDLTFQLCSLDDENRSKGSLTLRKCGILVSQSQNEERVGPTHIGGNSDQFVFCSLSSGAIGIWHSLNTQVTYGYFAPRALQDKHLSALSWKHASDRSHCLAAAAKNSTTIHFWRGRKVIWGVAETSEDLKDAYRKIMNKSPYLPSSLTRTNSREPEELKDVYRKITSESPYLPSPMTKTNSFELKELKDAYCKVTVESPYFLSQARTADWNIRNEIRESLNDLRNARQKLLTKSLYLPSPVLMRSAYTSKLHQRAYRNIADGSPFAISCAVKLAAPPILSDTYGKIVAESPHFHPPTSRFAPDIPAEILEYYGNILNQSPYFEARRLGF